QPPAVVLVEGLRGGRPTAAVGERGAGDHHQHGHGAERERPRRATTANHGSTIAGTSHLRPATYGQAFPAVVRFGAVEPDVTRWLAQLAPAHVRGLDAYQPGKPVEELERELG